MRSKENMRIKKNQYGRPFDTLLPENSILPAHPWANMAGQRNKVSKGAKIRNLYNQVPHLTQDTNGKVTNSHLDTTNESQEVRLEPSR